MGKKKKKKKVNMGLEIGGAVIGMEERHKVRSKVRRPTMSPESGPGRKAADGLVMTSIDKTRAASWAGLTGTEALWEPNPVYRGLAQGDHARDTSFIPIQPQAWEGGLVAGASLCKTSLSLFSPVPVLLLLSPPHHHVGGNWSIMDMFLL